ncbi:phosphate acyltransferase [Helicobacter monodelphidis]|uniref:phosphate acyltransferase PlsX n=1 Tax=Helicobacter sp. 15-1451 TaxID=2004995 RepID=UPI000DCC324F|nr:phosphate acyltransferase PlsX [Helicobacter sp. 15-1451]RAX56604.1 phosphate acyltransferase [Helicobacter sp. 15-1451]
MKIAVDVMGGDFGATPIIEGTIEALKEEDFSAILVGDSSVIESKIPLSLKDRVEVVHCVDFIKMDDLATNAIRRKESSIFVATDMLKSGQAHALVSAGHSGATMSLATLRVGRIAGVSRPAIGAILPRIDGGVVLLLDAGANVDCKPEHLYEFALMGDIYAKSILGYSSPKLGILSNGEEECKGDELSKEAYALLRGHPSFIGNIEGDNLFDGSVDVVICDGFVGNIVLKTSEGIADAIVHLLKNFIQESSVSKMGALLMRGVFRKLKKRLDYAEYGGAPLLGVGGNVIICHGKSNPKAIHNAIKQAILAHQRQVNKKIAEAFEGKEELKSNK